MPDWCVMVDSTGMLTFYGYLNIIYYDFYFQMRSMKSEKPGRNISQCFVPDKKSYAQFTTYCTKIFNSS